MKRFAWVLAVLAVAGVGGLAWWLARPWWQAAPPPPPSDPRLGFATPFRNVRPGVTYVGDEACAACHLDIAEAYRKHPMGQSFAPVAQRADRDRYDESAHNPFTQFGTQFQVRRDGDRVVHQARRKADDGRTLFETEAEAAYVLGSGTRGRSYLVERDGYLFQSPISWFAQQQRWDLSPGYGSERLFDRPIKAECLFCHANDANAVSDTICRYTRPIFRQHAIGCERCHGPGELHVASRGGDVAGGIDPTIVNPRHLEPALREAVCQQCHLQGQLRVQRRGRDVFDFRPGLPLQLFWSVFVRIPKLAEEYKAVGHVEQMHVSRCFQASQGRLGCTSCHDPHAPPEEAKRVAFYRDRCLTCHGERACTLDPAERRRTQGDDSCVACHMPRAPNSDIVHTAITDHRIPRQASAEPRRPGPPPPLEPGEVPILPFHQEPTDPLDPEASRDLGLALAQLSRELPDSARFLALGAEARLAAAAKADPGDVPSREEWAFTLWAQGRSDEALACYEKLLQEVPRRELALYDATRLANHMGRSEAALLYGRRLIEVNPWSASYHLELARALADLGHWAEAVQACRSVLRHNPGRLEARQLLIHCLLGLGDRPEAEAELETLVALNPAREGDLRRWFAKQAR